MLLAETIQALENQKPSNSFLKTLCNECVTLIHGDSNKVPYSNDVLSRGTTQQTLANIRSLPAAPGDEAYSTECNHSVKFQSDDRGYKLHTHAHAHRTHTCVCTHSHYVYDDGNALTATMRINCWFTEEVKPRQRRPTYWSYLTSAFGRKKLLEITIKAFSFAITMKQVQSMWDWPRAVHGTQVNLTKM